MTLSNIKDRGMSESEGRAMVAANDRRSWFPGTRALGAHGILSNRDGREVARCQNKGDRDSIVALARAFDDMRAALEMARAYMDMSLGSPSWNGPNPYEVIDAALLKAGMVKP